MLRPVPKTRAPAPARARATPRPTPRLAPVTTATCSRSCVMVISPVLRHVLTLPTCEERQQPATDNGRPWRRPGRSRPCTVASDQEPPPGGSFDDQVQRRRPLTDGLNVTRNRTWRPWSAAIAGQAVG